MIKTWVIYIYREFFKIFVLIFLLFFAFLLIVEVVERFSAFVATEKSFYYFVKYLFFKMIVNIYYVYPYILILSFIFSLFLLSRSAELLAFLTLGFKKEEILRKILILLFLISVSGEILLNFTVPKAFFLAQRTWLFDIEGKRTHHLIFRDTLFFEGDNYLLIGRPLEPGGEYLSEMTVIFFKENTVDKVLWAESGIHRDGKWYLKKVVRQSVEKDFQPIFAESLEAELPFTPQMLVITEQPVRFLSVTDLYRRYKFLKLSQRPLEEIWAEIFVRLLNLLSGLLVGIPPLIIYLATYSPVRQKMALVYSLILFFFLVALFLFLQTISQSKLSLSILLSVVLLSVNLFIAFKFSFPNFVKRSSN